jgi:hypothetical protein
MPSFGKTSPLRPERFAEFEKYSGADPCGKARQAQVEL